MLKGLWWFLEQPRIKCLLHSCANTQFFFFFFFEGLLSTWDFPGGSDGKASDYNVGSQGSIPRSGRSPGEGMAAHSSTIAWKIPRKEKPGRLQSMGSQRVRHDWAIPLSFFLLSFPLYIECHLQRWASSLTSVSIVFLICKSGGTGLALLSFDQN